VVALSAGHARALPAASIPSRRPRFYRSARARLRHLRPRSDVFLPSPVGVGASVRHGGGRRTWDVPGAILSVARRNVPRRPGPRVWREPAGCLPVLAPGRGGALLPVPVVCGRQGPPEGSGAAALPV